MHRCHSTIFSYGGSGVGSMQTMKILPMKILPLKSECRLIWLLSMIPVHGNLLRKIPPMKFSGLVRNHLDKPHRHLLADFCVTGAKIPGMIFLPMKFSWVRGPYATSWVKFSCMKIFGAKISFHPWKFHAHDFFMHDTFTNKTLIYERLYSYIYLFRTLY